MRKPQFIYIIQCNNRLKIGIAHNLGTRIKQIQTSIAFPIEIVAEFGPFDAAFLVERAAHRLLKSTKVRGEWFKCSQLAAKDAVKEAIQLVSNGNIDEIFRSKKYKYEHRFNVVMNEETNKLFNILYVTILRINITKEQPDRVITKADVFKTALAALAEKLGVANV